MKRVGTIITLAVIVILFIIGIRYIYLKDQKDPVVYQTQNPTIERRGINQTKYFWNYR